MNKIHMILYAYCYCDKSTPETAIYTRDNYITFTQLRMMTSAKKEKDSKLCI